MFVFVPIFKDLKSYLNNILPFVLMRGARGSSTAEASADRVSAINS
jgi:hypothetical protein